MLLPVHSTWYVACIKVPPPSAYVKTVLLRVRKLWAMTSRSAPSWTSEADLAHLFPAGTPGVRVVPSTPHQSSHPSG